MSYAPKWEQQEKRASLCLEYKHFSGFESPYIRTKLLHSLILSRVWGVRVTVMTGSSLDWILLVLRLQVLLITLNYNAVAFLHTLQFTVAHALAFSFLIIGLVDYCYHHIDVALVNTVMNLRVP
jgi:hypothetical protein